MWITNKLENRQFEICLFANIERRSVVGLLLGELEGNRENFPSWAGKRDCCCLPLTIQSNLDYLDLDYPDFLIISTFSLVPI